MTTLLNVTTLAQDWGGHHDGDWGWMAVMMVFMVLFWGVVIFGLVWLVRNWERGPLAGGSKETPEQILDRRLADGTVTVEEYEQRRAVLAGEHTTKPADDNAT